MDFVARNSKSIAIVGDGLLASELAFSLRKRYGSNELRVCQVLSGAGNYVDLLPPIFLKHSNDELKANGVELYTNSEVESAKRLPDGSVELMLRDKTKLIVDHVVVDAGIEPNVELAVNSGLELDMVSFCG